MAENYAEMTYGELKAACKAQGLKATGNKEALLASLEATPDSTPAPEPVVEEPKEAQEAPAAPAAPRAKVSDRQVETELRGDAAKMKAHLDKQKKIAIMIPLEVGVAPEVAEKIPFTVNLNGYQLNIKRGTFVDVPEQVAEMVKERLQSEGKIGQDLRIDRNEKTLEALG